jgi:hypothetical protein
MPYYADLDLQSLMDLLVKYTSEYMSMRTHGSYTVEQIAQCKQSLRELQGAIKFKSEQGDHLIDYIIPDLPDFNFPEQPRQ